MSFLERLKGLVRQPAVPAIAAKGQPAQARTVPGDLYARADAYFAVEANWRRVTSTNVHAVAYFTDLETRRGVLGVRFFPDGAKAVSEYRYFGVPVSLFSDMLVAGSRGRFVHERLRDQYATVGPIYPRSA